MANPMILGISSCLLSPNIYFISLPRGLRFSALTTYLGWSKYYKKGRTHVSPAMHCVSVRKNWFI